MEENNEAVATSTKKPMEVPNQRTSIPLDEHIDKQLTSYCELLGKPKEEVASIAIFWFTEQISKEKYSAVCEKAKVAIRKQAKHI